jgi:hypothetical protein
MLAGKNSCDRPVCFMSSPDSMTKDTYLDIEEEREK